MKTNSILYISVSIIITLLFGAILAATNVSADDAVDEINITVPVSCSLSGSGMDSHNTEINNGQSNSSIGETTMKVFCNDNNGFAIYAIGYTDNTDGKNVLTSSTLGSTHDIVTGTATSGDTSNWAMKLSTITDPAPTYPIIIAGSSADTDREQGDPDYSIFQEVPDDYTLVVKRTSGTDINPSGQSTAEGSTIKSTYQAYISKTQPAGTYTGQVKYTLIHPATATKPIKPVTIATAEYLQEVNSCPADLPEEQVYTLKDSRDEQEYKVAKLKDGKCWMVENLALDPTDSITAANMDASNTNASAVAIENYLNGGGGVTGWSSVAVSNKTSSWDYDSYIKPWINNQYNGTLTTGYGPASTDGQAKVGIYYNYCAATVGTYCYDSGSGVDLPDTNIDAPEDICPVNWRMPTGGTGGEYEKIFNEYNTTQDATNVASLQYNWSVALSGYRFYSFEDRDYIGHWWSSTYNDGYFMFKLQVDRSSVINRSDGRYMGYSVRCLLKTN